MHQNATDSTLNLKRAFLNILFTFSQSTMSSFTLKTYDDGQTIENDRLAEKAKVVSFLNQCKDNLKMIGQVIRLKIQENKVEEFEALVGKLMKDVTVNEPGSIYEIRRVRGEPLSYLYFISFPDQAAFDRYMSAEYHTEMSPKAMEMLDGDPVFEDLDALE